MPRIDFQFLSNTGGNTQRRGFVVKCENSSTNRGKNKIKTRNK
jgi:hypothetical protein